MSLWSELSLTYSKIASDPSNKNLVEVDKFLLEDGLTINNAGIEISLSKTAEVVDITLISKALQKTIFPVTPDSVKRSGGAISPNPLFEKLDYMAGDWNLIVEDESILENKRNNFEAYKKILGKWANFSKFPQIKIIYEFISKAKIIELLLRKFSLKDLIGAQAQEEEEGEEIKENLETSSENDESENKSQDKLAIQLSKAKESKNVKKLADIFVRFKVYCDDNRPEVYFREDILREWVENYTEILGLKTLDELDYISGRIETLQSFYPKKIRNQGDGARIISSNDKTIRTFGGRFNPKEPEQVATLGQKSMLEALYALSWLIKNNRAFNYDGLVVLSWSAEFIEEANIYNMFSNYEEDGKYVFNVPSNKVTTSLVMYGKRSKGLDNFTSQHKVNVLVLDGESKGRISICYYNELDSTKYYQNLENWCKTLCWEWKNFKTKEFEIRTPNFYHIYDLIHRESKEDKKLKKHFFKEILPCVIEGKAIPRYFVKSAFKKVCKPESFRDYFDWQENICVACAIFNKFYKKEKYMKLDTNETDRSYLFGRLLALAERIENTATNYAGQTNAERLFTRFTMRPGQTFSTLQKQLVPYFDKLYGNGKAGLANYFKNQIAEILDKMGKEEFTSNKALNEMFILGYYGQRNFRKDIEMEEENDENKGEE